MGRTGGKLSQIHQYEETPSRYLSAYDTIAKFFFLIHSHRLKHTTNKDSWQDEQFCVGHLLSH